jgi:hypothetical protein
MDFKEGDKVYWRLRIGMFLRTLSGVITKVEGDIATVIVNTQNIWGKEYHQHISTLTKNKRQ